MLLKVLRNCQESHEFQEIFEEHAVEENHIHQETFHPGFFQNPFSGSSLGQTDLDRGDRRLKPLWGFLYTPTHCFISLTSGNYLDVLLVQFHLRLVRRVRTPASELESRHVHLASERTQLVHQTVRRQLPACGFAQLVLAKHLHCPIVFVGFGQFWTWRIGQASNFDLQFWNRQLNWNRRGTSALIRAAVGGRAARAA